MGHEKVSWVRASILVHPGIWVSILVRGAQENKGVPPALLAGLINLAPNQAL